jgi:hypothetical protein
VSDPVEVLRAGLEVPIAQFDHWVTITRR